MAESVLSNIASCLIFNLSSLLLKEIGLWWGLKHELDKLKRTVSTIEAVLLHAEEQSMENPQLKHWLGLLSEALYAADDLLDEISTAALHQQVVASGSKIAKQVRLFYSSSNQFAFGLKMGHQVKQLRQRLDEIAAEKNKFHLEDRSVVPKARCQTHSSPPQVVIGREHEKQAIVKLLLSYDCEEKVSVIPIVGIGGLGKTTLAQMVYNDDRVKNHFELKMWVCVSNDFDVRLLVKNVLEAASSQAPLSNQMDLLKNCLHEHINRRRYLLLLDDVWNEDVNKWSSFKDLLADSARGSKIIITTRLRIIAEISRPIYIHELRGFSENESWTLFEQLAFKQGQMLNGSLRSMGKEIVEMCRGVPLAIKTIGGALYFKDQDYEWELFNDNELSKIDVFKHYILPILMLSYNHLPSHYKHCFAYCSLYPKNYRIPIDELIQLWNAQGYLKSIDSNKCLEDVGFEYFMDLFRLCFFQDEEKDCLGNSESCKMHDLMHDLAVSVSGDNFSTSHLGKISLKDDTQHMSFRGCSNYLSQSVCSLLKAKKILTVLNLDIGFDIKKEEINAMFSNLRCLRVLNLSWMGVDTLPNSIFKLKHLRYLDFSQGSIKQLPNSIVNLYNLQVLKLEECRNLLQLPSNITKLVNLTDLNMHNYRGLTLIPRGIGQLTRLKKLSRLIIAKDHSISKHTGCLDELRSLNNLSGELEIKNLRYVKNAEFAEAHLCLKQKLEKLALDWGMNVEENTNDEKNGIEALCLNPNLKEFHRGRKLPSWLPFFTNLVSVYFRHYKGIQRLPPFDHLPHLKTLWLYDLTMLEHINVGFGGGSSLFFPSLTDLTLFVCPNLKGFQRLSEQLPCFPRLSQLQIRGCPNLTCLFFRSSKYFIPME